MPAIFIKLILILISEDIMKLRIATLVLPLALACSVSFADTTTTNTPTNNNAQSLAQKSPQGNAVLLSSILHELQANGYGTIKSVILEDGVYKVDAFDTAGEEVTVKVNPDTGAMMNNDDDHSSKYKVTIQQAVAAVENAGYTKIKSIECDDDSYAVEALDRDGEEVELEVSRSSGAVSED
jgi:hypothetical protein